MKRLIGISFWLLVLCGLILWVSAHIAEGKSLTGPIAALICILIYLGTSPSTSPDKDS
jgi:hypothetical protein